MICINVPNESFKSHKEASIVNHILSDNMEILSDYIDDGVEIWIIGDGDPEFFNTITEIPFNQSRICDPFDELPISQHRKLLHIAVINHNKPGLKEFNEEIIYGNVDHNIYDFVRSLIFRLASKFPKKITDDDDKALKRKKLNDDLATFLFT